MQPTSSLIESSLYTTRLQAEQRMHDALAGQIGYTPCPGHPTGGPIDGGEVEARTFTRSVSCDGQSHTVWVVVIRRRADAKGHLNAAPAGLAPGRAGRSGPEGGAALTAGAADRAIQRWT